MWTPPGFDHYHRVYGNTDVGTLQVPRALSAVLPTQPTGLRHVVTDQLTDIPEQSLYLPEPRDDWLRALTRLLYADPADASTLTELGQAVGASERTFSRLFRTELGMKFRQWRTQLRIQHALVRLLDDHSVTDTAALCGWSNPTSFIDAFTAIVGQTPGRYQASLRQTEP